MVLSKTRLPNWTIGCFCCSLENCCNVQGYFLLVYYVAAFLFLLASALMVAGNWSCWSSNYWSQYRLTCNAEEILIIVVVVLMFVVVVSFGATIAFLRGIFIRRASLLRAYGWTLALHLLLDCTVLFWICFAFSYRWGFTFVVLVDTVLWLYLLVCAETLYHQMKDGVVGGGEVVRAPLQQTPTRVATVADPEHRQQHFPMSSAASAPAPPPYYASEQQCVKDPRQLV